MLSTWLVGSLFLFFLFTFSVLFFLVCFKACLHNCKKCLLSSWCPSVCSCVCTFKLGSHWMDFREIWYWRFLWKSVKIFHIWLKFGKGDGHLTWLLEYIICCRQHYLTIRYFLPKKLYQAVTVMRYKHLLNVPQCYVIHTLLILFLFFFLFSCPMIWLLMLLDHTWCLISFMR